MPWWFSWSRDIMQAGRPLSSLRRGCLDRQAKTELVAAQENARFYILRAPWPENWHWSGYKPRIPGLSMHMVPTRGDCRGSTVQTRSSLVFHEDGALAILLKLKWIWGSVVPGLFIQNVPCQSSWSWIGYKLEYPKVLSSVNALAR